MSELYRMERIYLLALDPVHTGTGGHQLGRVDLPIAREPGTRIPKIPGTGLSGAARHYAALVAGRPEVAGQHKEAGERGFTPDNCPVMAAFGTAADKSGEGSKAGAVRIGDARILFFPVWSKRGPVWVTTQEALDEAGFRCTPAPGAGEEDAACEAAAAEGATMNFGWLQTSLKGGAKVGWESGPKVQGLGEVKGRLYVLSTKLFSVVVNSGLEVRTSVSINARTGAAAKGALFSYEAIPRGTWMWLEAVEDSHLVSEQVFPSALELPYGLKGDVWTRPLDVLRSGLRRLEYLGVGGMGTRGFGRMRLMEEVKP